MSHRTRIALLDRRQFVVSASAAAALLPVLLRAGPSMAQDAPSPPAASPATLSPMPAESFDALYARLTKAGKPTVGKISLEVPDVAENGNTVPFLLTADSPMTSESYVKAIHLMSTANPQAGVAIFRFTPESGKAVVSSRLRLAKSQDIVALAEVSNGELWVVRTKVTVTIGGCGG